MEARRGEGVAVNGEDMDRLGGEGVGEVKALSDWGDEDDFAGDEGGVVWGRVGFGEEGEGGIE